LLPLLPTAPPRLVTSAPGVTLATAVPATSPSTSSSPSTPSSAESLGPAVATALAAVNQNPKDPVLALDLVFAYWDVGLPSPALQALARADKLAAPASASAFESAGDRFRKQEAWLPAAVAYRTAVRVAPAPGSVAADLRTNYHEALYKASPSAEFLAYLPADQLERIERPIALVVEARHFYDNARQDQARQILEGVQRLRNPPVEAALFAAEVDAAEGRTLDSRQACDALRADPASPGWIKGEVDRLLNSLK
jgi:hypothetical protein